MITEAQEKQLLKIIEKADNKIAAAQAIRKLIADKYLPKQPIANVVWIPVDKVVANDYNPNSVATIEMGLLKKSIMEDGYTQPVVVIRDKKNDKYVIVDGFHRTTIMKVFDDVKAMTNSLLPVVILDSDLKHRMASTVRHNRARGKHSTANMSQLVYKMTKEGMTEAQICNELGMDLEEYVRLTHISGFSKLFTGISYSMEWLTKEQSRLKKNFADTKKK